MKQLFSDLIKDLYQYIEESNLTHIIPSKEEFLTLKEPAIERRYKKKEQITSIVIEPKEVITPKKIILPKRKKEEPKIIGIEKPKVKKEEKKPVLTIEKQSTISEYDLSDIKKRFKSRFPHIPIIETPPSDHIAIKILQKWKYKNQAAEITILSFKEKNDSLNFLKALTKALDISFYPARIVFAESFEKEDQWEFLLSSNRLKLIIASDYSIFSLPKLMRFYKRLPHTANHFLKNIPLFILPNVSLYLKNPLLKASLWKALKQKITFSLKK